MVGNIKILLLTQLSQLPVQVSAVLCLSANVGSDIVDREIGNQVDKRMRERKRRRKQKSGQRKTLTSRLTYLLIYLCTLLYAHLKYEAGF